MRIRTSIDLRSGVAVKILVTPALYRIADRHGLDVMGEANDKDPYTSYIKILYCAAINAWEVDAVDDPTMGDFPYKYSEFVDWAWADRDRLAKVVSFIYEALTGRPLKEAVADEVKKKNKSR